MRVLITGANRGIGAALLSRYHQAGHDVIGTARSSAVLEPLDVTEPGSVAALTQRVGDAPLDLLICNAGVYLEKGLTPEAYTADMWAKTFAANVTGVALTVQALLPALRAAKGKIAIIASMMGSDARAPGGSYIYRTSKAAALNLGRNLSSDLATDGIAVGIYHPGWVQTDMGGPQADITVDQSADGLVERFSELDLTITGCFCAWDGTEIPF